MLLFDEDCSFRSFSILSQYSAYLSIWLHTAVCHFDKIVYLNIVLQLSKSTDTKLPAYLITFITFIFITKI